MRFTTVRTFWFTPQTTPWGHTLFLSNYQQTPPLNPYRINRAVTLTNLRLHTHKFLLHHGHARQHSRQGLAEMAQVTPSAQPKKQQKLQIAQRSSCGYCPHNPTWQLRGGGSTSQLLGMCQGYPGGPQQQMQSQNVHHDDQPDADVAV